MVILANNTMERLMKYFGAERVGEKSKEEMVRILEEIAKKITEKAITYSKHAKRKTIKREDVRLAFEEFMRS